MKLNAIAEEQEIEKTTKKTVYVDVDGTLADYSKGWQGIDVIGDPLPGSVEFTQKLSKLYDVVIYTTRCNAHFNNENGATVHSLVERVRHWLIANGYSYHSVYAGQGKPPGGAFVDDRAVAIPTNPTPSDYEKAFADCRKLLTA